MSHQDIALICLNGHVVNEFSITMPNYNRKYCTECGAKTINKCPNCNADIIGGYVDDFINFFYEAPAYCHNCGSPYPWTYKKTKAGSATRKGAENESLEYVGEDGKVRPDGKVETVLPARRNVDRSFDERGFHPEIRKHARQLFLQGHYSHAVLECCKSLEKYVREKSCLNNHGAELMGKALNLNGPIKINSQRTESERNEQEGIMHLCIGLMRAIRNPASHEPVLDWAITREDALDLLSLISYLFRRIEQAAGPEQMGERKS